MSLPPLNPDKTAAGIILDPRTLERVVPTSRRRDGTQRKELKIRPGFTPQEDVGVFRSTRQATHDSRTSAIPGSNRPPHPVSSSKPDNPFAQPVQAKTKAQVKNEKRREKKRTVESTKAWDEESSGDEEEGLREAFAKADLEHRLEKTDEAFPALGESSRKSVPAGTASMTAAEKESAVSDSKSTSTTSEKVERKADDVHSSSTAPGTSSAKSTPRSHPIKGGRSGPIGLAFPPPVEEDTPKAPPPTTRSDSATTWRATRPPAKTSTPAANPAPAPAVSTITPEDSYATTPEAEAKIRARNQARYSAPKPGAKNQKPTAKEKPAAAAIPPKPEPRVRKEVRIRQGGANDFGSLADRVKNLVLENAGGKTSSPRAKRAESKTEAAA